MNRNCYIVCKSTPDRGGIYHYRADQDDRLQAVAFYPLEDSNFMTFSPDRRFVYATARHNGAGCVAAYHVADDGKLEFLNELPTGGYGPCHLAVNPAATFLYCANYASGQVSEFAIDGALLRRTRLVQHIGSGPNPERQEAAHAHFTGFTPDGRYLCVIDLGMDAIKLYPADPEKGIDEVRVREFHCPPGSGPRHLIFNAAGEFAYLLNELGNSVTSLAYCNGSFRALGTLSTLPDDFREFSKAAAIRLSADGKFLFASNRGCNSIAVFQVTGRGDMERRAIVMEPGDSPRDFNFLPNGRRAAAMNEFSDNVVFFRYDAAAGTLTEEPEQLKLPHPLYLAY